MRGWIMMLVSCALAACSNAKPKDATCKDVEAAMRRIDGDMTKDLPPGTLERLCESSPDEYTQEHINCVAKAHDYMTLGQCEIARKKR